MKEIAGGKESQIETDILEALNQASTVLVHINQRTLPSNTYISFPGSDKVWGFKDVIGALDQDANKVTEVFEFSEDNKVPTGFFVRGGRQTLTNIFGKPTIFLGQRESVDKLSYDEWTPFYPGSKPHTASEWQVEFTSLRQATLTPKTLVVSEEFPQRIHIPNFPYIFERAMIDAMHMFDPESVGSRTNSVGTRQLRIVFDPLEIKDGLVRTLRAAGITGSITGKNVDVPGAYVGKFARSLKQVGLNVRASDAIPQYVDGLKEQGIDARNFLLEKLPKMEGGKFATITFELYPPYEMGTYYLAMLREMIRSEAGIIFVQKRDTDLRTYVAKLNRDINDYYPEIDFYTKFAQIYGLSVNIVDTADLRFVSLSIPSQEQRDDMYLDLRTMYLLRRAINHGQINGGRVELVGREGLNRVFQSQVDLKDMTARLEVTEMDLIRSLNRIDLGNRNSTHDSGEAVNRGDKEMGGPESVIIPVL